MTTMRSTVADEPDLGAVIKAYNEVTERLHRSHDALSREVCRLREELQRKNRELERRERLAALGEMAAGVAHEIRNPLGGIGLYASLLERDLADRPEQVEMVRCISGGISNLDGIVGDILAFAGDADPAPEPTTMGRILHDAIGQTSLKSEAAGVRVEVDDRLDGAEVFCDAVQVERALVNLILNAIDAAGSGGGCVRIRRDDRRVHDDLLRVVIEDDGEGIPPDQLNRVFDPFFTTKHTGTGLGLAIAHRIAESNGGSISAGNRRGGGAVFVLSVPLADEVNRVPNVGGRV